MSQCNNTSCCALQGQKSSEFGGGRRWGLVLLLIVKETCTEFKQRENWFLETAYSAEGGQVEEKDEVDHCWKGLGSHPCVWIFHMGHS